MFMRREQVGLLSNYETCWTPLVFSCEHRADTVLSNQHVSKKPTRTPSHRLLPTMSQCVIVLLLAVAGVRAVKKP